MKNLFESPLATGFSLFSALMVPCVAGSLLCGGTACAQQNNGVAAPQPLMAKRPNIVLIVADDLGYGDLSFTGSTQIPTPNIDRLARTGTFFPQGYVSSPVCSPSRAGFLTGINGAKFGYDNNLLPDSDGPVMGLPVEQKTLATLLKPAGYATGLMGKWHLGETAQFAPTARGFDDFWGFRGGGHNYFTSKPDGDEYLSPIECNYKTPQPISYITDDIGDESVGFIGRHKNQPFFLYASFNAPHTPMQAPDADIEMFSYIPEKKRRTYAAMVHRLDVNVGKIVDEVKKQGLANNTLFLFISDNGGPLTDNASLNAPYRGRKATLLEGGIRVPFIMNWPGTLAAGATFGDPVSTLDITPTVTALAGTPVDAARPFDGVDLMPYLRGEKTGLAGRQLRWRFTVSSAIRQGNWKLLSLPNRLPQLYDLSGDIAESNNLAPQQLAQTETLLETLGEWDVTLPRPIFLERAGRMKMQLDFYDDPCPMAQPARDGKLVFIAPPKTSWAK